MTESNPRDEDSSGAEELVKLRELDYVHGLEDGIVLAQRRLRERDVLGSWFEQEAVNRRA